MLKINGNWFERVFVCPYGLIAPDQGWSVVERLGAIVPTARRNVPH
jgi:hypothetical protein